MPRRSTSGFGVFVGYIVEAVFICKSGVLFFLFSESVNGDILLLPYGLPALVRMFV